MTEQRARRMRDDEIPRFFSTHLGGGLYHARMKQIGWTDAAIGNAAVAIMREEPEKIDEWCGMKTESIENPSWRTSLRYHTAMRILNEREGVHNDPIKTGYEKYVHEEPEKEPIDSWYEKDTDDDFDDIDIGID